MAQEVVARFGPVGGVVLLGLVLAAVTVERSAAQAKPAGSTAKPAAPTSTAKPSAQTSTAKPAAQTSTAKPAAQSTLSGIYTAAQAAKGEEMYYNMCIACHPKGTYAGPSFKTNWNGRPLSDLWDWISNKMPKNDPGSLTPDEVAQVMSYILQQNKMPAGRVALPANEKTMYRIKIQIK